MRARSVLLVLVAVLVSLTAAHGSVGYSLLDSASAADCKQLGKRLSRLQARYEEQCPSATPDPTRSPSPTATQAQDCSDGRFVKAPNPSVLQWTGRTYEPGRTYRLCATIPADAAAPGQALTLSSRNHANTSCGDFQTWLVAPSGATYVTGGAQPGVGARFERGTWQLVVVLDRPCIPNKALDYFIAWF